MNKFTNKLFLSIGIQVLILLSIIFYKLLIVGTGVEVLLKIRPVDPTSPLRGDYVTFQYDISQISYYLVESKKPLLNDTLVYVVLEPRGRYWSVDRVTTNKPVAGVFIKGRIVGNRNSFGDTSDAISVNRNSNVQVVYGIEQYFIPEGTGEEYEFRGREVGAVVKVDSNGNAVITRLEFF